ncbi:MAG: hypothetical protein WCO16_03600 [bacterium]
MVLDASPTQSFVPIKEVRDGVLILKDGSMRAVLLASSLNFALKSADEQQAITFQFQNFLNSLNFSVQISVQSRRLDIRPYIALLETRYKDQSTDLMRLQTREYIEFIKSFTEQTNIMTKNFFIVIPYTPPILGGKSSLASSFFSKKSKAEESADKTANFEEHRSQLIQRLEVVQQGLVRCGIRVVQLGTEELVEVFYKIFNPGDVDKPIHVPQK